MTCELANMTFSANGFIPIKSTNTIFIYVLMKNNKKCCSENLGQLKKILVANKKCFSGQKEILILVFIKKQFSGQKTLF